MAYHCNSQFHGKWARSVAKYFSPTPFCLYARSLASQQCLHVRALLCIAYVHALAAQHCFCTHCSALLLRVRCNTLLSKACAAQQGVRYAAKLSKACATQQGSTDSAKLSVTICPTLGYYAYLRGGTCRTAIASLYRGQKYCK